MTEQRRIEIAPGIGMTVVTDPKYKTGSIVVNFVCRHNAETAAANAAVAFMIEDTCKSCPTVTEFNKRLGMLYGAGINTGILRYFDSVQIVAAASCIADKYALEGEDITCQTARLLTDCIFDPVTEFVNGEECFPEKQFRLKKQELIDDIDADINDKRGYALKNAGKIIYEGEPAGIPLKGEHSGAEALTASEVYKAYKNILRTARIEIVYVGCEISPQCERLLIDRFGSMERENIYEPHNAVSPVKPSPVYKTDRLEVAQSKMVMAYKTDKTDYAVSKLFTALLGGTPFSLLFKNVREKLSLCYYCSASYSRRKGVLFIDSGVENANIEAARAEIMKQVEMAARGEFSDELLEKTKLLLTCALKSVYDYPRSAADWIADEYFGGELISPEDAAAMINAVTREQICKYGASLKLDTVYVLTGKEE
ncbi:MAG: insulinase family protein [Oscillospiraceae bacterium]|nr:insulinase family protein [Oscillospiraceae bacterium]